MVHLVAMRRSLGDFLRTRRERLRPEDVGLAATGRRRTPGLRREEVAARAGLSTDWYMRLEQGRDVTPSVSVLEALAGALSLSHVERAHLFRLARSQEPPILASPAETVAPALLRALESLRGTPAFILGRRLDVLAWNAEAARVIGNSARIPEARRNLVRMTLLVPEVRALYVDWRAVAAENVAALRAASSRHPRDPSFAALIELLAQRSATFRKCWKRHEVSERSQGEWALRHPSGARLQMRYDALATPDDPYQRLVFFTPVDARTKDRMNQLLSAPSR
jgi:transcriptional regulator with XRE-family HTH domain